jgi:transposase
VAQTCARAVRLCRGAGQEHLPAGPVPAPQSAQGPTKAAIGVAASILTAVYHMLRDGIFYNDLGPQHFARHDKTRAAMRLVRRIKDLGYDVEIKAAA